MQNMRLLERQQQILLEMRSRAPANHRQAAGQGVPEAASWLQAATKEVEATEAEASQAEWRESGYGWRLTRKE